MGDSPLCEKGSTMATDSNPASTSAGVKGNLAVENIDISEDEEEDAIL